MNPWTKKIIILALFILGLAVIFTRERSTESRPGIFQERPFQQGNYPSSIIDLSSWKLTLPIKDPGDGRNLLEISQPELATYENPPWFAVNSKKDGVVFRAPVNAPTTDNSEYSRSELRETVSDGDLKFWSSTEGVHTLEMTEAITAVPKNKPEVVAGQIHGDDDDILTVRLDHPKLYLARSKKNLAVLDDNYELGRKFSIKMVASGGEIKIYYNNSRDPVYALSKKVNEAYFKAGAYTQSNCETEGADNCNSDNFGEVVIYDLKVEHSE